MEFGFEFEVCSIWETLRILAEPNEEAECIEFRTRCAKVVHFSCTIGDASSGEDVFEDLEEVSIAGLSERVPLGLRKFEYQFMPASIGFVQRMDDGNVSQLALPFGSRSVGGGGSM